METWDAIRSRRNVRSYQDRAIAPAHLDRILEAGWRSPSASNRQKWDFVLVTERAKLDELATVWQGAGHLLSAAAAIVLVVPDAEDERFRVIDQYDLGQATYALALAAADLGIGSCHSSIADKAAARRILGFPDGHEASYMLSFGYPADRPLKPIQHPTRRPIEEVVHRGGW